MSYVYIDGASLDLAILEFAKELGHASIPFDYGLFLNNLSATRAFYYDALPSRKETTVTETEYEFKKAEKEQFFSQLNRVPRLHVRYGTTKWAKRVGQEQKAVDVLLAVDVLTHAHSQPNYTATIVTSDLDFQPLFSALLQTPATTLLYYRPNHTNTDLIESADWAFKITHNLLLRSCDPSFAAPYFPAHSSNPDFAFAEPDGAEVEIVERGQPYHFWKDVNGYWIARLQTLSWRARTLPLLSEQLFGEQADEVVKRVLAPR